MEEYAQTREDFLAAMADFCQAEGMPPIAGRLFGLLVFDGGTLSFAELADRLQVSRASISTSARHLEARGLLRRVSRAGSRETFYELPDNPYNALLAGVQTRANAASVMITQTINAIAGQRNDGAQSRLSELAQFYDTLQNLTAQAIARLDGENK